MWTFEHLMQHFSAQPLNDLTTQITSSSHLTSPHHHSPHSPPHSLTNHHLPNPNQLYYTRARNGPTKMPPMGSRHKNAPIPSSAKLLEASTRASCCPTHQSLAAFYGYGAFAFIKTIFFSFFFPVAYRKI